MTYPLNLCSFRRKTYFLSLKENSLPLPSSLLTSIFVPCASKICLTMAKPKPVPPAALDRAVFVRMRAPRRMMGTSGISGIVARLSGVAGIDPIYAHRLRHTAAMDVLAAGGSLTEAKELLGHAYTLTTMSYAKVDLVSLRELVVPFGQVPR